LGHRRQHLGEAAAGPMDPKLLDLTLGVKIPVTPGSKPVFSRGKLGEKLHRPSGSFDLGDPLGRRMSNEYNSLHDPHLQAYHQRKDNLERLKSQGFLTSNGNVVCSLKEFNQYRQYRTMLKLEAEKAFIREQEKPPRHLPKLEHAPKLTGEIDTSSLGQRLLLPQKPSCLGQRLLLPQKPSCPPPPKGENNSMKWGRRLSVHAALGKGQSPPQPELGHEGAAGALRAAEPPEISSLHHRQQIGLAAKQLTATVSESLGKHFASGTSEPGPVAGGTTEAGKSEEEKSGQAETAASDRATSKDLLHHLTREAVNIVCSTLEAIGASQSEGGCSCTCSAMLELLRGGVSNRRPQPPQAPFSSPGVEEGQGFPGAPEERSLEAAKGAKWPGPGSGEESRPAEDTRPSTGPQLCRQPVPPAAPKGPAQRAARRRAARGQPVGGEPQQPRQQRGR
ncbi:hypothetical protein Q9233_011224, partial [Columba guinea]